MVAAVSTAMGRPPMPAQRLMWDVGLEVQSEAAGDPEPGAWAYDAIDASGPRRMGKTAVLSPVAAHRARMLHRARMFMTAQTRDKARKRWMDITDDLLATPLRDDVRRKVSQGFEELRWIDSQSTLEPFAPNEDGLHGETPDLVFVDEKWAYDAETARAVRAGYVPAFGTSGGQAWGMSTAGTAKSAWLNETRAVGRRAVDAGVNIGTAWFEWGLPDVIGGRAVSELEGDDLVAACIAYHPAVCHTAGCPGAQPRQPCPHGFTVRAASLRSAWDAMGHDRAEYLRAYGNRSADDRAEEWRFLDRDVWLRRIDAERIPADARPAIGVWVDEDSQDAAVAAGWRSPDGIMHAEHLEARVGTTWVTEFVAGVVERHGVRVVAVGNVGAARAVGSELATKLGKDTLLAVSQADVSAACARHRDELDAARWVHRHHDETMAAAAAVTRGPGKAWKWAKDGGSISALGAETLAGWAADHAPAEAGFWIG